jgi:hypothetical protein
MPRSDANNRGVVHLIFASFFGNGGTTDFVAA